MSNRMEYFACIHCAVSPGILFWSVRLFHKKIHALSVVRCHHKKCDISSVQNPMHRSQAASHCCNTVMATRAACSAWLISAWQTVKAKYSSEYLPEVRTD